MGDDNGAAPHPKPTRTPSFVSVVVPCFNAGAFIGEQLDAFARQNYTSPWELVISDNGSTDQTLEIVSKWVGRIPRLTVVIADELRGPSHARNLGVSRSHGDLILFADADDVVHNLWIADMVAGAGTFDIVRGYLFPSMVEMLASERLFVGPVAMDPRGFRPMPTGNLAVWRVLFEQLGGFDVEMRTSEDWDFSYRAQIAGAKAGQCAGRVFYRERKSFSSTLRQNFRYGFGQQEFYRKHPELIRYRTPTNRSWNAGAYWLLRSPVDLVHHEARLSWARNIGRHGGILVGRAFGRTIRAPRWADQEP